MKGLFGIIVLSCWMVGMAVPSPAAEEAEKYPGKPVTMNHAFAAGGSTDMVARAIAAVAPKYFSQPIIIVPKPGGSGLVSLQALASARPDGYTLHFARTGDMTTGPIIEEIPIDVEKEFTPLGQVGMDREIIAVHTKAPWKTVEEFIADAKKEPGKIKFATSGVATGARFAFEKFCSVVGIKLTCVPFKGNAPSTIAVAGGHIPVFVGGVNEALPHVQRGDMRVIITLAEKRVKEYPDSPAATEKGWDATMGVWHAVFARRAVPPAILSRLEEVFKKVVHDPDYISAMYKMGAEPLYLSGKDFFEYWRRERKWVAETAKVLGLKKEQ